MHATLLRAKTPRFAWLTQFAWSVLQRTDNFDAQRHDLHARPSSSGSYLRFAVNTPFFDRLEQEDFKDQATFMGTVPDAKGNGRHTLGSFHIRTKVQLPLLKITWHS
jgi:hypothetical protein